MNPPRLIHLAIAAALPAIFAGCATAPAPAGEEVRLVWPPAPQTTRIRFLRSITSEEDLGRDTTFSQELVNFLAGERPPANRVGQPLGIAVSGDGSRLYVSDYLQHGVFIFDFPKKAFSKIGGLAMPAGIALDAQENIYVVETPKKTISVYNRERKRIKTITDPSVVRPVGIAIDSARDRIYLVDTGDKHAKESVVWIFDLQGKRIGKIGHGRGETKDQFINPTYVAVDASGNIYVSDTMNSRVQQFDAEGKYLRTFGGLGDAWGYFDKPKGVAVDSFGNLYVADSGWSNVQIFNPKGQVLLFFGGRGPIPGMMKNPTDIAIDKHNRIYVADYLNHRIGVYELVNTTAADSFLVPPASKPGAENIPAASK
jgi:DNA-binding beta-propeller fold protein YncE